ncbi:MAG TPA: RNA-guided endonuclease TnpB family protein [Aggregatilineaceae bacterium]|nr:RNA-guided endonuclease TnpB family protein [Aggregatilineaceae bacterium]
MKVYRGYQFKLKATPAQEEQFWQYCGAVRWVYNHMLAQRQEAYRAGEKAPTTNAQINQLPGLKRQAETAWLKMVHSQVLQDAVLNLDNAFERFFTKKAGAPQFKKKHSTHQSFTYPAGVKVEGNRVSLPMIGWVPFRRSAKKKRYRAIEGTIKRTTVRHKASGWYVSLTCLIEQDDPEPVEPTIENSVGIDLGSKDLVVLSDGRKVANPRLYRQMERKLAREQRKLSRKQKGSANYRKQKAKVAKLHEKVANQRLDTLHRISHQLVSENQALFAEKLNVRGIARRMGKSVGDAGWSELLRQLEYKAQWAGKTFVQVDRFFPSSKTCSCCGAINADLTLDQRTWTCPSCGTLLDRDINAAINIQHEGLKHVAAGLSETKNACGEAVRPAKRARLREARISRL